MDDFPVVVLRAEDGGDAEYVRLGRRAVDGRGGVLERHGIGEVAARPAARTSFSYAVQFENDAPSRLGAVKQRLRRRSAALLENRPIAGGNGLRGLSTLIELARRGGL